MAARADRRWPAGPRGLVEAAAPRAAAAPRVPGNAPRPRSASGPAVRTSTGPHRGPAHPRHLDALESDRFGDLPGPVYAKGFLRNYATYLGLSPDELIQELVAARAFAGEGEPPPASVYPETRVAS